MSRSVHARTAFSFVDDNWVKPMELEWWEYLLAALAAAVFWHLGGFLDGVIAFAGALYVIHLSMMDTRIRYLERLLGDQGKYYDHQVGRLEDQIRHLKERFDREMFES